MDQAEQLRKLVKQGGSQQKNLARVITVTSGKGGVGKSSISVNLAIELARMGKRVLIMDVDFGLANIEVMLGIRPEYNLADMMFRGKSLADIVIKGPEGIGFISGGSGIHELTSLTREQIVNLTMRLVELDEMADIVIIDTGISQHGGAFGSDTGTDFNHRCICASQDPVPQVGIFSREYPHQGDCEPGDGTERGQGTV